MIPSKTVGTLPVIHSRRTGYLGAFAAIAFAISWAIEIPLALVAKGVYSWEIPFSIHYLAAFGPGIAGIIMTWEEGGIHGLRGLFIQSVTWRVGIVWWVVAFSPLL